MSTLRCLPAAISRCRLVEIGRNAEIARKMVEGSERQDPKNGFRSGKRRGCRADRPVAATDDQQRISSFSNSAAANGAVAATAELDFSVQPHRPESVADSIGEAFISRNCAAAAVEQNYNIGHFEALTRQQLQLIPRHPCRCTGRRGSHRHASSSTCPAAGRPSRSSTYRWNSSSECSCR